MKTSSHCIAESCLETSQSVQTVQIEVARDHPLLLLKRALRWDALTEVMTRHWREYGKNVDGGPGLGCLLICALDGVDADHELRFTPDGSLSGRERGGPGVSWASPRCAGPDSRPFQQRWGQCGLRQRGYRRGQHPRGQGGASLWLWGRGDTRSRS